MVVVVWRKKTADQLLPRKSSPLTVQRYLDIADRFEKRHALSTRGTSHATTAGAASHSSTEATSIPEDTPLDPSEAHFITARRAYLRGVQQQEDLERARKWTVRNGADWFDNFHGELSVPIGLQDEVPYPLLYGRGSHDWSMVQHLIRSRMFEHPTFTFSAKRTAKSKKPMPPIPTRVLDLGCGVYAPWILEMARFPGWQHTRFVGLDIAPVLLPLGSRTYMKTS